MLAICFFFLNCQSTQSRTATAAVNVIEAIVLFAPSSRIYLQTVRSSFPYCIWVIIFSVFLLYWCCLLLFPPARPYLFMPFLYLLTAQMHEYVQAREKRIVCLHTELLFKWDDFTFPSLSVFSFGSPWFSFKTFHTHQLFTSGKNLASPCCYRSSIQLTRQEWKRERERRARGVIILKKETLKCYKVYSSALISSVDWHWTWQYFIVETLICECRFLRWNTEISLTPIRGWYW